MSNRFVRYSITGGLSSEEIHEMYEEALKVLEDVGVKCLNKKILSRLAEFQGLTIDSESIHFKKELIDELLKESLRKRKANPESFLPSYLPKEVGRGFFKKRNIEIEREVSSKSFRLVGPYTCLYILDGNSDKPRQPTLADLRNAVKLCDAMCVWRDCAPLIPVDIPPPLQRLAMLKTSAENSPVLGGVAKGVSSIEEAEFICEMGKASGREPPYFHLQFFISPLKYNDAILDIAYYFLERGEANMISMDGGPMPVAGSTAPFFVPGIFIQAIAETLASEALSALLFRNHENKRFSPSIFAGVFDMRYSTVVFGSPEALLFSLAAEQINQELFGHTSKGGTISTMSHTVDEQAAAERAFGVIISALAGANTFGSGGMISLDMTFSPEQLVIDREIIEWVERFIYGLEVNDNKGISAEVISEVGPSEDYLTHPTTVGQFRRFYWEPDLFKHMGLSQWQQKGSVSLRTHAQQTIQEKIKSHRFEIDTSIRTAMDDIYKKAERQLLHD